MKSGYRPILRFATFAAAVFVFVFTLTWFALAQDGAPAPVQPPAQAEVEVNLDALGALDIKAVPPLARPSAPAPVDVTAAKKIEVPREVTVPPAVPPMAVPAPLAPPLPPAPADGSAPLPPSIVPVVVPGAEARAADLAPATAPTPATATATGAGLDGRELRLLFDPGSPALTFEAVEELATVAARLAGNSIRVDVHAYAGGPDNSSSDNHNLSLKRALSVRGYLVEQGIPARRIDLHAEGSASDRAPPERADLHFRGATRQASKQD